MTTYNTKITHLFHSGYAVQTKDHFMLFDHYQPLAPKKQGLSKGIVTSDYLKTK